MDEGTKWLFVMVLIILIIIVGLRIWKVIDEAMEDGGG